MPESAADQGMQEQTELFRDHVWNDLIPELFAGLMASEIEATSPQNKGDAGRRAGIVALLHVLKFLGSFPMFPDVFRGAAIREVLAGLIDIENGVPSPMFVVKPKRRAKDPITVSVLKMRAAIVAEMYHRDGLLIDDACKRTADRLQKHGVKQYGSAKKATRKPISKRTVKLWRAEHMPHGSALYAEQYQSVVRQMPQMPRQLVDRVADAYFTSVPSL